MTLTLNITTEELKLLIALASDQLFRREFIDPKMPGHKSNSGETEVGKALVNRLKLIIDPHPAKKTLANGISA